MNMSFWNRETKQRQGGPEIRTPDLFRLEQRTIVVTGGSGALGVSIACALLESGADVLLLDIREPDASARATLKATREAQSTLVETTFMVCDVASEASVKAAFDAAAPLLKHPLRGLVSCAGISGDGPSIEWTVEEWTKIHDVNVLGTFIVAREAAMRMRYNVGAGLGGSIVLVASMSGGGANRGVDGTAYNSSKAAVQQMARSLASEWGANREMPLIRVNSVSPGYIESRLTVETLKRPGVRELWEGDNMLKRISTPDEYRGPVVFLLSEAASFVTGTDLKVDGGHTAW